MTMYKVNVEILDITERMIEVEAETTEQAIAKAEEIAHHDTPLDRAGACKTIVSSYFVAS